MLNPAHILEIALLLLVAFLIGATIGSVARLAVLQLTRPKVVASSEVESLPAVEGVASLVTAPVIEPVTKPAPPVAPAEAPAMDFTEALLALAGDKPSGLAPIKMPSITPPTAPGPTKPAAEMAPARAAGATTSGRLIAHPQVAAEPVRESTAVGLGADVILFPIERVPVAAREQLVMPVVAELQPQPDPEVVPTVDLPLTVEVRVAAETEVEIESPVAATVEPAPAEPVAVTPASSAEDDEAAAMRAIEGNWSPRRGALSKARKVALPEGAADEAVAASAAAVASAVQAANVAVAAEPEEAPGRPAGLPAPRHGVKDDLTHVIGILPIIETALNRLGVYHFDQVAELTDENAEWIETHLGIEGRVGREHWREQARELASAMAGAKKAAGK